MALVSIESESESQFITDQVRAKGKRGCQDWECGWWTAGVRVGNSDSWRWEKHGDAWPAHSTGLNDKIFRNWNKGEPNNHGSDENCIHLWYQNGGTWDDHKCYKEMRFICEVERMLS